MKRLLIVAAIMLLAVTAFGQNWFLAGSHPQDYSTGGDPSVSHGAENGGFIKSTASEIDGFGTLMTSIDPANFIGNKVRLTAFVKTENVKNWVGMWMRVDAGQQAVSFDNMEDRPITGTSDWKKYEILLEVPESSTAISYGVLLAGTGGVWFDGLQLEKME